MRTITKIAAALLLSTAVVGCTASAATAPTQPASATVKVMNGLGHGSGVHIGGGYIITAGHVTDAGSKFSVKTSVGQIAPAEVLWGNFTEGGYDVSLIHVDNLKGVAAAELSCDAVHVGQEVRAEGNPLGGEFITFWGKVAGTGISGAEKVNGNVWQRTVTLDMAGAGGLSGGPVYDERTNEVVGIVVAGIGRVSPYMLMVPGDTICHVMGRV